MSSTHFIAALLEDDEDGAAATDDDAVFASFPNIITSGAGGLDAAVEDAVGISPNIYTGSNLMVEYF